MFYNIPADRTGMSAADLRKHLTAARKSLVAALRADEKPSAEDAASYRTVIAALAQEVDDQADVEAAEAAEAADLAAAQQAADAAEQAAAGDDDEDEEVPDDDDDTEASAPVTTAAPVVHTGTALSSTPSTEHVLSTEIEVVDSAGGKRAGQVFSDFGEFGMASLARAKNITPGTTEKFEIGRINGRYDAAHQLGMDPFENIMKLGNLTNYSGKTVEEITAALCAPATPHYGMACMNTTRRPVAASLPGFEAPRGKVSIYPSPSLSSVSGSAGIWTAANDANGSAEKGACATIACSTSTEYALYGVYWCLTVKNMELLTFPELVEAYLNRGAANYARLGERQLLDAMGAGVGQVNTEAVGYGAATRVSTQILQYLAFYREMQRWDDVPMHGWAPRWLQIALQIDLSRRNRRDGSFRIATEAEVNQVFADAGINMTWYLDIPTWGVPVPNLTSSGNLSGGAAGILSRLPSEAEVLIAPEGKFAMIDRAQVSLGVTGNNWYRDNASNKRNEVTYFFENYEGIVDTTSCPAHIINFQGLCYSGHQIADKAMDCLGVAA